MNRKDRQWLIVLTLAWFFFTAILAYIGYQLGQETSKSQMQDILFSIEDVKKDLHSKQNELAKVSEKLTNIQYKQPKNGKDGRDGMSVKGQDGKDGVTKTITEQKTTVVEKPIHIKPVTIPGANGKTPELAVNGETKKWMFRYIGDEEWSPIPVLCNAMTVPCEGLR